MSRKVKWYNWVGDPYWNDYCKYSWIFIFTPALLFFGFIAYLIITGRTV